MTVKLVVRYTQSALARIGLTSGGRTYHPIRGLRWADQAAVDAGLGRAEAAGPVQAGGQSTRPGSRMFADVIDD
jgi:hypothetical protein